MKKKLKSFIFIYILIGQVVIFQMVTSPYSSKPESIVKPANEGSISISASRAAIIINQFSETEKIIHLIVFKLNDSLSASGFDFPFVLRNKAADIPIVKNYIINSCDGIQKTIPRSPPSEIV